MKKVLGLFTLLMIVMSFTTKSVSKSKQEDVTGIVFKHISLEDAKKQAVKSGKIIFIDAYTSWCGPCKAMTPILEALKKDLGEEVSIIKIDVDKNPQVASAYKIQGVPKLIIFKDGQIKWRQSGVVSAQNLQQLINQFSH